MLRAGPLDTGTLTTGRRARVRLCHGDLRLLRTRKRRRRRSAMFVTGAGATYQLLRAAARLPTTAVDGSSAASSPGQCDIRAADYVINALSDGTMGLSCRFQYNGNGQITGVRRSADTEFVPVHHGELTLPQIREIVQNTPGSPYGVVFGLGSCKAATISLLFASVDHVHADVR